MIALEYISSFFILLVIIVALVICILGALILAEIVFDLSFVQLNT